MPTPIPDACQPAPKTIAIDPECTGALIRCSLMPHACYPMYCEIPINVEKICMRDDKKAPPETHFWNTIAQLPTSELRNWVRDNIALPAVAPGVAAPPDANAADADVVDFVKFQTAQARAGRGDGAQAAVAAADLSAFVAADPYAEIVENVKRGRRPFNVETLAKQTLVDYQERPAEVVPRVSMVLHFRMCVFKGDYGFGEIVGSFALFPGEKTEIAVRSYENRQDASSRSRSILDSFTSESADSFQTSLSTSASHSTQTTEKLDKTFSAGFNVGVKVKNVTVGIGASGGLSASTTQTINDSMTRLATALNNHSSSANAARSVEVNTASSSTASRGEEQSATRTLQNINWSRTLNFFLRQMNQEYVTITYLDHVTFHFTNGYPEQNDECGLDTLGEFLSRLVPPTPDGMICKNKILAAIRLELSNIQSYDGAFYPLIECFKFQQRDVCDPANLPPARVIIRKIPGLSQTYKGQTVPGIITAVQTVVMRTAGVFVDTVMGRGEALDCYNSRLQGAASRRAEIDNEVREHREAIISAQPAGPDQLAAMVKLAEADCCPDVRCDCDKTAP